MAEVHAHRETRWRTIRGQSRPPSAALAVSPHLALLNLSAAQLQSANAKAQWGDFVKLQSGRFCHLLGCEPLLRPGLAFHRVEFREFVARKLLHVERLLL